LLFAPHLSPLLVFTTLVHAHQFFGRAHNFPPYELKCLSFPPSKPPLFVVLAVIIYSVLSFLFPSLSRDHNHLRPKAQKLCFHSPNLQRVASRVPQCPPFPINKLPPLIFLTISQIFFCGLSDILQVFVDLPPFPSHGTKPLRARGRAKHSFLSSPERHNTPPLPNSPPYSLVTWFPFSPLSFPNLVFFFFKYFSEAETSASHLVVMWTPTWALTPSFASVLILWMLLSPLRQICPRVPERSTVFPGTPPIFRLSPPVTPFSCALSHQWLSSRFPSAVSNLGFRSFLVFFSPPFLFGNDALFS